MPTKNRNYRDEANRKAANLKARLGRVGYMAYLAAEKREQRARQRARRLYRPDAPRLVTDTNHAPVDGQPCCCYDCLWAAKRDTKTGWLVVEERGPREMRVGIR